MICFPVHDDVDGGVDDGAGDGGAAGHVGAADPPQEEHGAVVVDVQERQVVVLAPQREEHSVLQMQIRHYFQTIDISVSAGFNGDYGSLLASISTAFEM